jgi:hypothetical protein
MIPRITAATIANESVTMIAVKALALTILKPPFPWLPWAAAYLHYLADRHWEQ